MAKTIKKVNVEKAAKKRNDFLNIAMENIDNIESIHISLGNSKMGKIPSFSVLPIITCKNCSECSKYCYASKNCYEFNSNILNLAENTAMMKVRPDKVEKEINDFLNNSTTIYKYFRFNVAGDIFTMTYLQVVVSIAKNNPFTRFLVFTKNYDLMNNYFSDHEKPDNLAIVFSKWSNTEIDNPLNFPVAQVNIPSETVIDENSFHCNGDCTSCLECWNAKKGTNRHFDLH